MQTEKIQAAFAALSGRQRLRILETLKNKELACEEPNNCDFTKHCCSVGEIADAIDVTLPTASHHLNALRQAGLITSQRDGQHVYYKMSEETITKMIHYLQRLKGDMNE